ncbi:hypothetical protein GCM10009745_11570 [Kribbella yunnanensis]|uniref:DUF2182 domain-containing protein n=1 Tax=Kribbella yunnanensis TaxID=190194 RepID=A0ABN2GFZ6_9ACTN
MIPRAGAYALCSVLYGTAHLFWAATGPPEFARIESVIEAVWIGAIPALLAAAGYTMLRSGRRMVRWAALGVTWLGCAGMAAYCLLLWPTLAQLLTVPFGEPMSGAELGAVGLRLLGTASAAGLAYAVRPHFRALRGACLTCGRLHATAIPADAARIQRWGLAGAYFAVGCCTIRMIPAVRGWIAAGGIEGPAGFVLFVALLVLAGTLLPLALAHSWGRVWPRWLGPLAGRRVPRWLVLGPGVMMSVGLSVYFGIGGLTALLLGLTGGAVEIIAYIGWGLGLAVASASYARRTRPRCRTAEPMGTNVRI